MADPPLLIEQLFQERFLLVRLLPMVLTLAAVAVLILLLTILLLCILLRLLRVLLLRLRNILRLLRLLLRLRGLLRRCSRRILLGGTLEDLVQLPPVKPDAPAIRAVIDLDPLTFGHDQVDGSADRTFHNALLLST